MVTNCINEVDQEVEIYQQQLWSNLPDDIIILIMEKLYYADRLSFRGVCKRWRLDIGAIKYAAKYEHKLPWLVTRKYVRGCTSLFYLYDPSRDIKYSFKNQSELLIGARCLAVKHGWILFFKEDSVLERCFELTLGLIFFYSPFTNEIIELTQKMVISPCDHVTFSTAPTSPDCVIFMTISTLVKGYVWIRTCSLTDGFWTSRFVYAGCDDDTLGCIKDVAYAHGVFYCKLTNTFGGYNVAMQKWNTYPFPYDDTHVRGYPIIESQDDGELLMVYRDSRFNFVGKFDQSLMKWTPIEGVDGELLIFIGLTSTAVPAREALEELEASHFTENTAQGDHDLEYFRNHYRTCKGGWYPKTFGWRINNGGKLWIQPPQPR